MSAQGFGGMDPNMINNMGFGMNNMNPMNNNMGMNNNIGFGMNNMNPMNNNMGMGMGVSNPLGMNNVNMSVNQAFNPVMMNMMNMQNMPNMSNMQNMQNAMMNNIQNLQNMQNQFNSVNIQNNQNPTPSNSVFINVFFRISNKQNVEQAANDEQANIISVQCTMNDKVSEIIEKYRTKSLDREKKFFIYNAKKLNESLSAAEAGINDRATIFVLDPKNVKGA